MNWIDELNGSLRKFRGGWFERYEGAIAQEKGLLSVAVTTDSGDLLIKPSNDSEYIRINLSKNCLINLVPIGQDTSILVLPDKGFIIFAMTEHLVSLISDRTCGDDI